MWADLSVTKRKTVDMIYHSIQRDTDRPKVISAFVNLLHFHSKNINTYRELYSSEHRTKSPVESSILFVALCLRTGLELNVVRFSVLCVLVKHFRIYASSCWGKCQMNYSRFLRGQIIYTIHTWHSERERATEIASENIMHSMYSHLHDMHYTLKLLLFCSRTTETDTEPERTAKLWARRCMIITELIQNKNCKIHSEGMWKILAVFHSKTSLLSTHNLFWFYFLSIRLISIHKYTNKMTNLQWFAYK